MRIAAKNDKGADVRLLSTYIQSTAGYETNDNTTVCGEIVTLRVSTCYPKKKNVILRVLDVLTY